MTTIINKKDLPSGWGIYCGDITSRGARFKIKSHLKGKYCIGIHMNYIVIERSKEWAELKISTEFMSDPDTEDLIPWKIKLHSIPKDRYEEANDLIERFVPPREKTRAELIEEINSMVS